jgi:hypothetical protein
MRPALPSPKTGVNRDGLPTVRRRPALPLLPLLLKKSRKACLRQPRRFTCLTQRPYLNAPKPLDHTLTCRKVVDYRQGDSAKLMHLIDLDQFDR